MGVSTRAPPTTDLHRRCSTLWSDAELRALLSQIEAGIAGLPHGMRHEMNPARPGLVASPL